MDIKEILNRVGLTKTKTKEFSKLLKDYKYVDGIDKLKVGSYVRWIKDGELKRGMFICDIVVGDNGLYLKGKIFNRVININVDDCILFQKLSNEELIIRYAMNSVNTNYIL